MCHNDNKHKYLEQVYHDLNLNPVMMNSEDVEKLKKELKDLTHESFLEKFIKDSISY